MPGFTRIAALADIPPGGAKSCNLNGTPVALYNVDGTVYATHGTCVHRGGPLGDGTLDGAKILCPWHLWEYDVRSGECSNNPEGRIACFPVRIEGQDVLVEV
jgi:nitrite reductase (NADH) small subunit